MTGPVALIVGASGQVGRNAARAFASRGQRVVGTGHSRAGGALAPLDLADGPGIRRLILNVRPAWCVISSALTAVDRCEAEPGLAEQLNARAPEAAALACREVGAQAIFLSTEYVFDGTAGPYDEGASPRPLSVYGRSKLSGEVAVLGVDAGNLVIRTTVVFSLHQGDKNFLMQVRDRLQAGGAMRVPADQVSSPTYAPALGEAIATLAGGTHGIVNVAGPEVLGRFEFALRIARRFGLDEKLIEPVETATLHQPAARPLRAGLRVDLLRSLGVEPVGISAALDAVARLLDGAP
jgi:dTDP-4-dehydrorhamnose reductase